jgi:hemerythrin-like metal-binding protein
MGGFVLATAVRHRRRRSAANRGKTRGKWEEMGTTRGEPARDLASPPDSQHEKLVGLIDELRLMILGRDDAMAIAEVLDDLASFAGCEFAEQEALMRSSGAPDWRAHKRRHDEMASRLRSLQSRFEYEPDAVGRADLYDFLSDWLGHVLGED